MAERAGHRALLRLRHGRDVQSLAYLVALPALVAWQWRHGFDALLYALVLFLTLGVGVIHHNHTHRRMWHGRATNRLTDFWITLLQGHPTFVFWPAHVGNHHRHRHGPRDVARTYRFGGDTNDLRGYLLHPFQAVWVLMPLFAGWLGRLRMRRPGAWRYCMAQYALWLGSWAALLTLDWQKALLFVIVPQLHGLHWLLATNYLQHAHADGRADAGVDGRTDEPAVAKPETQADALNRPAPGAHAADLNYARNFEGLVNPLLFNIGLHTAHHEHANAHWSELAALHRDRYRSRVDPALNERGLVPYMFRVFVLGPLWPRFRSRSLMPSQWVT